MSSADGPTAKNGERIPATDIAEAVTRASFTYTDGATQVFTPDGRTVYTENGGHSSGEWEVDDQGRFWSFWPPSYRAAYDVFWVTDADGLVTGVRFSDLDHGSSFEGLYAPKPA